MLAPPRLSAVCDSFFLRPAPPKKPPPTGMDVRFDDGTTVRIENIRPDQDVHDVTEGCVLLKRMTFSPEDYKERVTYFADCVAFLWDRSGSPGHVSMLCS